MYLATRRIRSAGRSSGSIEITLPAELQVLEGVECRLTVRDGARPEIVLQPELSEAQVVFQKLWHMLRLGLGEIDDIGEFSSFEFTLTLFTPGHWHGRPPLACADALSILKNTGRSALQPQNTPEVTRLLAFLSIVAAERLGLTGPLALAFSDAVAYLVTGIPAGLGTEFERGMARQSFWGDEAPWPLGSAFGASVWEKARPGLRRVHDRFQTWQDSPESYSAARDKWYRARTMELGIQAS